MLKRIIAVFSVLLSFCLISGCGKNDADPIDRNDSAAIENYFKFENAPKEIVPFLKGTKRLTEEDVIRISEKDEPSLEDLKDYACIFSGDENAYVIEFEINDRISLQYVYNSAENDVSILLVCADDSTALDIRTGDVQKYINERKA
ncbi:MAG: hypothetical protein PUA50_01845 [Eubacteriales bacterium]|nr:hypothetical protein [Eubacteriales bacterium]